MCVSATVNDSTTSCASLLLPANNKELYSMARADVLSSLGSIQVGWMAMYLPFFYIDWDF